MIEPNFWMTAYQYKIIENPTIYFLISEEQLYSNVGSKLLNLPPISIQFSPKGQIHVFGKEGFGFINYIEFVVVF